MINIEDIDLASLSCLPLRMRYFLPKVAGVYLVLSGNGEVLYVGRSVNLYQRWSNHNHYPELQQVGNVNIAWIVVSHKSLLPDIEKALVEKFHPKMNIGRVSDMPINISVGGLRSRVKDFLAARSLSAYQFIKETGIAPATGYKLAKKSDYLPSIRVLEVICDTYRVQPGEILEWVDGQ